MTNLTAPASRRRLLTFISALGFLSCLVRLTAAPLAFDIAPQPAPTALELFIKQSGAQVVYLQDDVKDTRTNALAGQFEPKAALLLLLKDTDLKFSEPKAGQFTIGRVVARPGSVVGSLMAPGNRASVAGVIVKVIENGATARVGEFGDFRIPELPPGTYNLVASGAGFSRLRITDVVVHAGVETAVGLQELPTASGEADVQKMKEVVVSAKKDIETLAAVEVSGEKIKPFSDANVDIPRTTEDAKPYFIFNASTIDQSGTVNMEEFLNKQLPMNSNFVSGSRQGSESVASATATTSVMSLRGLGTAQTLILLNGRRLPAVNTALQDGSAGSSVDLNSIPISIVDRIEVLPSSASGIYGGNAIGGVINIITKRNYSGGELKLTYDNTFNSDTAKRRVDFTYGATLEGGRTHLMLFASKAAANFMTVGDREGMFRRSIARVVANNPAFFNGTNPLLGTTPRVDSVGGVPLVLKGGQSLGSAFVFVPAGYRGFVTDGSAGLAAKAGILDNGWPETQQWYNGRQFRIYNVPQTDSIRAEVRRQMLPSLEVFLSFSYDRNISDNVGDPSSFASLGGVTVPAAAPSNPFNQSVVVRMPSKQAAGLAFSLTGRRNAVGGFSLKLPREWLVLGDYSWNTSALSFDQRYTISNTSDLTPLLTTGTLDPFVDLQRYPDRDIVASLYGETSTHSSGRLREASLRAAGPLGKIFFMLPSLALGAQTRVEERGNLTNYIFSPISPTPPVFAGSLGAGQKTGSAYGELTVPLVPREFARFGLRLLELQLTGRRDEYTTALRRVQGTTATSFTPPTVPATDEFKVSYVSTNPTYGVRYKPVDDLMFRVAFAKGFLPPTAAQLVPGVPSTVATALIDPRRGSTSVAVIANPVGGNPNVIPETSENWSAGAVFTPKALPGLRLAVDYTFIKKTNNISSLAAQVIVNNEAIFPGRVTRGPVPAGDPYGVGPITGLDTTTLNLYSTSVTAYDFSAGYRKTTATRGTFEFNGLATVTEHYLQRITLGAPLLEYVGTPTSGGPLKFRGNLSASWSYGQWQIGWSATYYDSYKVSAAPFTTSTANLLNNGGPTVPSQIYHDVFARYRFEAPDKVGAQWRRLLNHTELLVGVRNVFNKEPAFDGGIGIASYFLSPYGDDRMASYYLSFKRGF